jgi:hypothetical protein
LGSLVVIGPGGEVVTLGTANPRCAGSIPAQASRGIYWCYVRRLARDYAGMMEW